MTPTLRVNTAIPGVVIGRSSSPREAISAASNFSSGLCVVVVVVRTVRGGDFGIELAVVVAVVVVVVVGATGAGG